MLGRVNVDVDGSGIDFKKQYEGRMTAVEQHVAIRLPHGMSDQLVAHGTAIHEEILQIGLTAREGRQPDPAPQVQENPARRWPRCDALWRCRHALRAG